MTKIEINGRKYSVKIHNVLGFCTSASVRIGGREFESRDYPYQFTANAIDGLLARVCNVFPTARLA